MILKKFSFSVSALVLISSSVLLAQSAPGHVGLNAFVVYFPHVARGVLANGSSIETIISLSNPAPDVVEVQVVGSLNFLASQPIIRLQPGQSHSIKFSGEPLQVGYVKVSAMAAVSAVENILIRPSPASQEIISQVTIPGKPPVSKVVVPIFRRTAAFRDGFADNTAIAISLIQSSGTFLLTLRDSAGGVVSSRRLFGTTAATPPNADFGSKLTVFITELFPNLPENFTGGSLVIDTREVSPRMFAITALYVSGQQMWNAPVTPIDVPRQYILKFKTTEVQQLAAEMATQYGFAIKSFSFDLVLILATDEVARAVERDPRIVWVEGNNLVDVSG